MTDSREQRCFYHPDVKTRLRCSRCDKPICPRCMIPTPVGYRCRECARGPRPVLYQPSATGMLKAVALGVLAAVGSGAIWGYFPDWAFYCTLLLGFSVAEAMAWGANYKRGRELQFAAWGCVLLGLVVSRVMMAWSDDVLTIEMLLNETTNPAVAQAFQLELLPDVIFMAIPFVITYIRFK